MAPVAVPQAGERCIKLSCKLLFSTSILEKRDVPKCGCFRLVQHGIPYKPYRICGSKSAVQEHRHQPRAKGRPTLVEAKAMHKRQPSNHGLLSHFVGQPACGFDGVGFASAGKEQRIFVGLLCL